MAENHSRLSRHRLLQRNGTIGLTFEERASVGRQEADRLDAICRSYDVPLHTWFGGAVHQRVTLAVALRLDAVSSVPSPVRRVVLASDEPNVATLMASLHVAANKLGPNVELALQLDAQLHPAVLEPLRDACRRLKLAYIADPCADLGEACSALPLAVSAHVPRDLTRAMIDGGVQILLVDPVRVGGPEAVRMWATAEDLTGVELALLAHDDSTHAAQLCGAPRVNSACLPLSLRCPR
jgi:L-alanine-DL-glutamate epimerase-like enolase superfamily enzyme